MGGLNIVHVVYSLSSQWFYNEESLEIWTFNHFSSISIPLSLSLLFSPFHIYLRVFHKIFKFLVSGSLHSMCCLYVRVLVLCVITCPVLVLCHCNADSLVHLLMI